MVRLERALSGSMRYLNSRRLLAAVLYPCLAFAVSLIALIFASAAEAVSFGATALACHAPPPGLPLGCLPAAGGPGSGEASIVDDGFASAFADLSGRLGVSATVISGIGAWGAGATADIQDTLTFRAPPGTPTIIGALGGQVDGNITVDPGSNGDVLMQIFSPGFNFFPTDNICFGSDDEIAPTFPNGFSNPVLSTVIQQHLSCAFEVTPNRFFSDHVEYHLPFEARMIATLHGPGSIFVNHTFTLSLDILTPGVTWTSDSGVFLSQGPSSVPEPASIMLLGSGLAGVFAWALKTRRGHIQTTSPP